MDGKLELGIEFQILFEQNLDGLHYFYCDRDDGSMGNQMTVANSSIVIDYTPERELFFIGIRESMSGLLKKMLDTMIEPEKLISFIDANQKLIG